jgi:hypothetical protein
VVIVLCDPPVIHSLAQRIDHAVARREEPVLGQHLRSGGDWPLGLGVTGDKAVDDGGERGGIGDAGRGIQDPDLDGAEPRLQTGVPPRNPGSGIASERSIGSTARLYSVYVPNARGMPTRGNIEKICVLSEAKPESLPSQYRELPDRATSRGRSLRRPSSARTAVAPSGTAMWTWRAIVGRGGASARIVASISRSRALVEWATSEWVAIGRVPRRRATRACPAARRRALGAGAPAPPLRRRSG